jgi:predicted nucleic acid-binding protein
MRVFVDSNVPMYVAGRDHPCREPARRFLARVRTGEVEACTSTEILQEILYRYVGLRRVDLAIEVYELFVSLCPVVLPVALADTDIARDLLREHMGVSVRDLLHAAVMRNHDITRIASFDRGFDSIPWIERLPLEADA